MRLPVRQPLTLFTASTLLLLAAPQASQALLVYSAKGSSINGSLGSVSFTNADWSLTATANESLASFKSFTNMAGTFQFWTLPVSPHVKIESMATVLEADLAPSGNFGWLALSGSFPVGPTPKIGFVYTTPFFNPEKAAGVFGVGGSFVDLQSPQIFNGPSIFETYTYPTSTGENLVISTSSTVPGQFRIDPVPGPLPALAVPAVFSWSRRYRARIGRRAAGSPG